MAGYLKGQATLTSFIIGKGKRSITSRDKSEQISCKQVRIEHSSYEGSMDDCDHHYTYFEASESESDVDNSQSGEEDNDDKSHNDQYNMTMEMRSRNTSSSNPTASLMP